MINYTVTYLHFLIVSKGFSIIGTGLPGPCIEEANQMLTSQIPKDGSSKLYLIGGNLAESSEHTRVIDKIMSILDLHDATCG